MSSRPDKFMADLGDLSPGNGLSEYSVGVAGLDNLGQGRAAIRFKLYTCRNGVEQTMATLTFEVPPGNDGMEGMVARGYDGLIDGLRQMLYQAALSRKQYRKRADLYAAAKARSRS
jgi:hypothetical protein